MDEVQKQNAGAMWTRLGTLETQSAAQSTDIRGIYAGLDEIRDVLVRMQESAKPNLGALFLVLLATCTFLVTVGGLALAPVYRDRAQAYAKIEANTLQILESRERIAWLEGGHATTRHYELVGAKKK